MRKPHSCQPGLNLLQPTSECGLASTWVRLKFIKREFSTDTRNPGSSCSADVPLDIRKAFDSVSHSILTTETWISQYSSQQYTHGWILIFLVTHNPLKSVAVYLPLLQFFWEFPKDLSWVHSSSLSSLMTWPPFYPHSLLIYIPMLMIFYCYTHKFYFWHFLNQWSTLQSSHLFLALLQIPYYQPTQIQTHAPPIT